MNTVPQHVSEGKILVCQVDGKSKFIVKDGPYYNPSIGEWEVWLDDQVAVYGSTEAIANGLYREALRLRKDHYEAENTDDIPFLGEPLPYDDSHETGGEQYGLASNGQGSRV